MLRLLDFYCEDCDIFFEKIIDLKKEKPNCPKCSKVGERSFPRKSPSFRLKYDNKNDMCDWSGNTSRYWDDYKKMKSEGKNPRIPALDGDG